MAVKKKTTKKSSSIPARQYGLVCFYVGLALLVTSLCINFLYLRPTDFKNQFREHQLADCLKTTTSAKSCLEHFGEEK